MNYTFVIHVCLTHLTQDGKLMKKVFLVSFVRTIINTILHDAMIAKLINRKPAQQRFYSHILDRKWNFSEGQRRRGGVESFPACVTCFFLYCDIRGNNKKHKHYEKLFLSVFIVALCCEATKKFSTEFLLLPSSALACWCNIRIYTKAIVKYWNTFILNVS